MKQLANIRKASLKYLSIAAFFLSQGLVWAQETTTTTTKDVDVDLDVDSGGGTWYAEPWVWIVGVAIFIIIIVGLLKSNKGD